MLKQLLSKIIKAAVTVGERRLKTISNPLIQKLVFFFIGAGEDVLLALLDNEPNNNAQILAIAKKNAVLAINLGAELGRDKVGGFKDIKLSHAIIEYLNGIEEVLKALIDENPDNEGQVLEIWRRRKIALIGDSLDIVTDRLAEKIRQKIKDPIMAGVIIELLQSLDSLVNEPATT